MAYRGAPVRQFRPEGERLNCGLPYTMRNAEDYCSPHHWRVYEAMSTKGLRAFVTEKPDHSWHCDMSYGAIARQARVCLKTVYNAIRRGHAIGLIQIVEVRTRGRRRMGTVYVIRPYANFLADMRANPAYFHTAEGHTVGRGRNPKIQTPADAERWKLNPMAPPKPRSFGPIAPSAASRATQTARRIASPEDLERVMLAFRRAQAAVDEAGAKKALAIAQQAYAAMGETGDIAGATVEALILQIAREYRPNAAFRTPTPGWFFKQLPDRVSAWVAQQRPEPHARTG